MSINSNGSEFDLIRYIKSRTDLSGARKDERVVGIGDDAAVFRGFGNISTISSDMLVEGVDFEFSWGDPYSVGFKSLEVSLSDIAAMGSMPRYSLLSLAIPKRLLNDSFLRRFVDGYVDSASESDVRLIGGDISGTEGPLVIDSTVIGDSASEPILRSGAMPGDLIYVSGELGGASAGLELLCSSKVDSPLAEALIARQLRPRARRDLGIRLGETGLVSSMIDLSDGLCGDLQHILESSGVGALIQLKSIPIQAGIVELIENGTLRGTNLAPFSKPLRLEHAFALIGGEDFELLFTVSPENENRLLSIVGDDVAKKIGVITDSEPVTLCEFEGEVFPLPHSAFTHF